MSPPTLRQDFDEVMTIWKDSLDDYSLVQLQVKEDNDSWSLGQLYIHLIEDTVEYNFLQVEICLATNRNRSKKKKPEGQKLFDQNSFPDARLKGPPSVPDPDQPQSLKKIREGLARIENGFHQWTEQARFSTFKGKTKHPGFGWFDAQDWLQFVVMHLRHHLKQKERIEKILNQKSRSFVSG